MFMCSYSFWIAAFMSSRNILTSMFEMRTATLLLLLNDGITLYGYVSNVYKLQLNMSYFTDQGTFNILKVVLGCEGGGEGYDCYCFKNHKAQIAS